MTLRATDPVRSVRDRERVDLVPAASRVDISIGGVARLAGCGGSSRWSEAIAQGVAEARGLLDPRIRIAAVAGDVAEALISKDSPVHAIAAGRPGWIYVATIGKALELRVGEHMRASRYLEGVLLDAAGSQAVESLADIAQAACDRAPVNARFAPGYCGWRLDAQPALLRALSAEDLGVGVLPSNAMEPLKTTTGIVVAGVPESLRVRAAFCQTCTAPGCTRRVH